MRVPDAMRERAVARPVGTAVRRGRALPCAPVHARSKAPHKLFMQPLRGRWTKGGGLVPTRLTPAPPAGVCTSPPQDRGGSVMGLWRRRAKALRRCPPPPHMAWPASIRRCARAQRRAAPNQRRRVSL